MSEYTSRIERLIIICEQYSLKAGKNQEIENRIKIVSNVYFQIRDTIVGKKERDFKTEKEVQNIKLFIYQHLIYGEESGL